MPIIEELNNQFILNKLVCPPNKKKTELVFPDRSGGYISVTSRKTGVGTYYIRYKDSNGKTCHHRFGTTKEVSLDEVRNNLIPEFKAALKLGHAPDKLSNTKPKSDMTLEEFFTQTYVPTKSLSKKSIADDEAILR